MEGLTSGEEIIRKMKKTSPPTNASIRRNRPGV